MTGVSHVSIFYRNRILGPRPGTLPLDGGLRYCVPHRPSPSRVGPFLFCSVAPADDGVGPARRPRAGVVIGNSNSKRRKGNTDILIFSGQETRDWRRGCLAGARRRPRARAGGSIAEGRDGQTTWMGRGAASCGAWASRGGGGRGGAARCERHIEENDRCAARAPRRGRPPLPPRGLPDGGVPRPPVPPTARLAMSFEGRADSTDELPRESVSWSRALRWSARARHRSRSAARSCLSQRPRAS